LGLRGRRLRDARDPPAARRRGPHAGRRRRRHRLGRADRIGIGHGWRRVDEPLVVIESDGTRILRLDDRPALGAFLERLGAAPGTYREDRRLPSAALDHALGLERAGGEELRAVRAA